MTTLQNNKLLILFPVLAIFAILAYLQFTSYKPSGIAIPQGVKGTTTKNTAIILPQPLNTEVISNSENINGYQTTLKTQKQFNDVYAFYQSVLNDKGWTVDHQNLKSDNFVGSYKKDAYKLTLSIFAQEENLEETIVSLDVYKD